MAYDLDEFKKRALEIAGDITAWRRGLHQIPETGIHTPNTQAFICAELDKMGIPYRKDVGGNGCTGVVALIEGKNLGTGKVFAIRADCDGLPIAEETGLPFASTNGSMHACGHDAHSAIALGTAKIVKENASKLEGKVKILFQPGEEGNPEGPGGAKRMLDDGALENPHADVIVGLHVGKLGQELALGSFGFRKEALMACMDRFEIVVKGVGSHGSAPQNSIDPIMIAAQIISTLQTIVSREFSPLVPVVISFGSIHAGSAFNIIPSECKMSGTIRALKNDIREILAKRIGEIAKSVAEGMRGSVEYDFNWDGPAPVVNNPEAAAEFQKVAEKLFAGEVVELAEPLMGGEDMAFFLGAIPGMFYFLNTCDPEKHKYYHHNSKFDIDDTILWKGSAVMSAMAFQWLSDHK
ncbi:MAG: amidohydrolase [Synergistaceae bacterium]|jgi:amidohydrolase|nr:amidohydrolase [Synergistaceae bacterium]